MVTREYTREEVEDILRIALSRTAGDNVSHADLLAAAEEVGIPADVFEDAVVELDRQRSDAQVERRVRKRWRSNFWRALSTFVIVVGFLTGFDVAHRWRLLGAVCCAWLGFAPDAPST